MVFIGSIMGTIHQGHVSFRSAGTQCTAIAYFAIVTLFLSRLFIEPGQFDALMLDNIVTEGDAVYNEILESNRFPSGHYLSHDELPNFLETNAGTIETTVYTDMLYGVVGDFFYEQDTGALSLVEGLNTGFQISDFLLCTFEGVTVALAAENGVYYIFDSHCRDEFGNTASTGSAVLLQFSSIETMHLYLQNTYSGSIFNLSPVVLTQEREQAHYSEFSVKTNKNDNKKKTLQQDNEDDIACTEIQNQNEKYSTAIKKFMSETNSLSRAVSEIDSEIHIDVDKYVNSVSGDHNYILGVTKGKCKKRKALSKSKESTLSNLCPIFHPESNITCLSYYNGGVANQEIVTCDGSSNVEIYKKLKLNDSVSAFYENIQYKPDFKCKSCDKFLFINQVHVITFKNKVTSNLGILVENETCSYCYHKLKRDETPCVNTKYNLLDPGSIPSFFSELSLMEKRLISKIHVFLTIIMLPGGQFGEKGLAIDFPVNFEENVNSLPHSFASCNVISVSYGENKEIKPTHLVRKTVIYQCLKWLKENNIIYKDVEIDQNILKDITGLLSSNNENIMQDFEEYGTVSIDYNLPIFDLEKAVNSSIKHIKLPRCTSSPVNAFNVEKGEESAFPYLFPFGKNGYNQKRPINISLFKYFQHKLYFADGRFRKDIPYLMHAVNYFEYQRLLDSVNIHMRMRKKCGNPITAKDVNDLKMNPDLIKNSYMFMKLIRGTAAYWKNQLLNLLSMFKMLGPPSIFVTLSANDMHWPDLIMNLKGCSFDEACKINNALNLVKNDPFLTAIHFQRRFKSLLKHIILGNLQPLGKVIDYFARIEFQNRGSPHVHMFFWIDDFNSVYNNKDKLINYIDSVISTSGLDENAVKFQTHAHTDYCLRKHGKCRFGFPYRPNCQTKLLNNIDMHSAISKARFYELKRRNADSYINAYNPIILKHWQANMDIQVIGNAESAAYYVCAYICKSEPEDLKFALHDLIDAMPENISHRNRMLKIGCCVLKTRKLSAQEAAYRLSDLNLICTSRTFISINTKEPNKRYKILKPKSERDLLPENSTDIFCYNLLDYYRCRPFALENVCFYEFALWYVKCPKPSDVRKSNLNGRKQEPRIQLLQPFQNIYMRKRVKSVVIRTPKFDLATDDYFYSLLLLYLPHRHENDILKNNDIVHLSAKDAFVAKKNHMVLDSLFSVTLIDEIENAIRFIRCSQIELSASICPATTEVASEGVEQISDISIPTVYKFCEDSNVNITNKSYENREAEIENELYFHSLEVCLMSPDEINAELQKLTNCQKKVIEFVMNHFKSKTKNLTKQPFHIFITGAGGVGKSHLLRLLIEWLKSCTSNVIGSNPVLVTAPTGTAARNINGQTIHSALHLPVQHGMQPNYSQLPAKSLKKLRQALSNVHTLIIDEISMVSSVMLEHIHNRLCAIKDSEYYFGGLNVITVGDFFQLRPVRGHFAFKSHLWSKLFKPFFLIQNVRQSKNETFCSILSRARVGMLTKENVTTLNTRVLSVCNEDLATTIHLYPTRKQVEHHNEKVQSLLQENVEVNYAKHYFSNNDLHPKSEVEDEHIPADDRDAGGLPSILKISVGTKVMLIRNIYTSKGLVNGAVGTVTLLEKTNNILSLIYVKFDDPNIGKVFQVSEIQNSIPIEPICQEFHNNGRIIVREQFPLIPSWACTIHKVQGASLQKAAISIGNNVFQDGMSYVALSRVTSLQGLYLLSFNSKKVKASSKVLDEYIRLRSLNND